jgi:hypothetical protein
VGVLVTTMLRPKLLDQCLRAVFRNILPVKVRLVVNGDDSAEMKRALEPWRKWAVEVVSQERKEIPVVYNEGMRWARNNNYKYLINIDDDITVDSNAITNLVKNMENDPGIFACAGYIRDARKNEVMLGGPLVNGQFNYLKKKPGVYNAKWIGSGFTIYRLDEMLPYDESYGMGYNDYDWCMHALSSGKVVAVSGDAGAYHKVQFTNDGVIQYRNPPEYKAIRNDEERHARMADKFKMKWGFLPRMGPIVE